jgi:acyl-CoA thioester hydrolase
MEPKDFKHKIKIQVRYKDVDNQGHVNNAVHLTYFETARVEYFKDVISKPVDWSEQGMILARNEIDYFRPILLEDEVYCYTKVISFGTKSFEMGNIITIKKGGSEIICAKGKIIIVCFNYKLNQTIEIPAEWKNIVNKYESL